MNNFFTKAETIDFTKARLVSTCRDLNKKFIEPQDVYTQLTRALQMTLDINQVIRVFMEHLVKYVPFDHFEYYAESQGIHLGSAKQSTHSCDYHLSLPHEDLGNLKLTRNKKFNADELAAIENLLTALVYPLRNALLYKLAVDSSLTDGLTQVANKRAFEFHFLRETEIAKRHSNPLSLIVMDIDKFKNINDNFGHSAGDQVLRQVVKTVENICRKSDLLFRYGGEEFVVILRETNLAGAYTIAERIRKKVQETRCFVGTREIPVTVSLGVSAFTPDESPETFFDRADDAMYQAKKSGRNRTRVDTTDTSEPDAIDSKSA
ncbi:MAG: hypothetical protein CSA50_02200 [Gammaproteobacteria bacterium]|nr:MAG: hypothetical protein CSA50_02200 [Gammaproteobacteria bacterium]